MNQLTKNLNCLVIRGSIEMWLERDELERLVAVLKGLGGKQTFLELKGRIINTFEIVGVFTPEDMQDRARLRKGQWKCDHGKWWQKHENDCECEDRIGVWGPTQRELETRNY